MGNELVFTGNETLVINSAYKEIINDFTYEFWVKPEVNHEIDKESISGEHGIHGKKYVIGPVFGEDKNSAGMGISVGMNGVSVYEHSINYLPALLVYETDIAKWTHIAVVYKNKTPFLYINGKFIKKGLTSKMDFVFPSGILGGYSPYGFFHGSLKNIRLWRRSLTETQIEKLMNENLVGTEEGLEWYWNQSEHAITQLGDRREIEVSVIIPSYDKYPQNLFTLYSLDHQTFDTSKMEVIFVDDGSTDSTALSIIDQRFSYLLKYIKCQKNIGRAKARNVGIKAASGKVYIFLDAEILVEKDFIEQHYLSLKENQNLVVSAVMQLKGIYSIISSEFEQNQLEHFYELIKQKPDYLEKWQFFKQNTNTTEILTKEDILENKFQDLSFSKPLEDFYNRYLLQHYGDHFVGFHFPWLAFMSGNVSVKKELLDKAGYFDESFEGYGWEDIELGYRLYLAGASFFNQRNIRVYHQEHPVSSGNVQQARKNYQLFQKKHPVIDVYLLGLLEIEKGLVFQDINNILIDYKQLCKDYPNKYHVFKETFKLMLEELGNCLRDNQLPGHAFKEIIQKKNPQLNIEKRYLQKRNRYRQLVKIFNLLENS
ncbi:glycosyltransferase [Priestia megaterium]|nr:glycosyltransferase [Priestia megaterium]